jgi:DNA-binding MarR family transcriptional regulator
VLGQRPKGGLRLREGISYMQHKGLDLDDYLPYLVNRVGRAAVEIMTADALAAEDLTIDMWRVLAALNHDGSQRQVDLSARTSIEASSLSRVAARLEGMGLVARQRSKTSSREVTVALSAKGSALVARLIPIALKLGRYRDQRHPGQGRASAQAHAAFGVRQSYKERPSPALIRAWAPDYRRPGSLTLCSIDRY